jgi:predicted tellurium resistance membrane protein TerC
MFGNNAEVNKSNTRLMSTVVKIILSDYCLSLDNVIVSASARGNGLILSMYLDNVIVSTKSEH